jgi:hypothetical protein
LRERSSTTPTPATSPGELHFTVYAADGTVLAEYDEDE